MITFPLTEKLEVPALGLGTWRLQGDQCLKAVSKALEIGYRHIDTADAYENHREVGEAIKKSNIPREEIFLTTKVWRDDLQQRDVLSAAKRFLEELQTDYLDLLLIHWPNPDIPIQETLEAFESLRAQGLIQGVGVSNFTIRHIKDALKTGVKINNNQVEFHPSLNQKELKAFCDDNDILLTAYSPIARGEDLELAVIQELAKKYDRPPSQVVLNWIIQKGMIAIPKSSKDEHILDNFKTLEWELDLDDVEKIDRVEGNNRVVHPSFASFED